MRDPRVGALYFYSGHNCLWIVYLVSDQEKRMDNFSNRTRYIGSTLVQKLLDKGHRVRY